MSTIGSEAIEIKIAHSPDSDDAFMFYGLATNKVRVPGLKFTHVLCDIETLNHKAISEAYFDVTAISFHAYPYLQDRYALMPSGGSVGDGYGPMIVAAKTFSLDEVKKLKIAIPGTLTTAVLALKLFAPEIQTEVVPFDKIIPAILEGKYDAGLIIHEGQLTYDKCGLRRILDLGKWWRELTGLPLPLGANAIRKDLGPETIAKVCKALRDSIQHALDNREQALAVRHAVCPRSGREGCRQVRGHVCERAHPGLRRRWPRGGGQAAQHGPRKRHHSAGNQAGVGERDGFGKQGVAEEIGEQIYRQRLRVSAGPRLLRATLAWGRASAKLGSYAPGRRIQSGT